MPVLITWLFIHCVDSSKFAASQKKMVSYKMQELHKHLGSPPVLSGVHVADLFSFLCCVFCFVCLHPVSCVPNVASFSGLSILDCLIGFSNVYSYSHTAQC